MKQSITKRMKQQAMWYSKKYSKGDSWLYDDLMQECYLSFCVSEKKYDVTRGLQFEGFAVNCMRNHLINYLTTMNIKFNHQLEIISEYNVEDNFDKTIRTKDIDFSLYFAGETIITIMDERFNKDFTVSAISEKHKMSQSKVVLLIENALLNKKLEKAFKEA